MTQRARSCDTVLKSTRKTAIVGPAGPVALAGGQLALVCLKAEDQVAARADGVHVNMGAAVVGEIVLSPQAARPVTTTARPLGAGLGGATRGTLMNRSAAAPVLFAYGERRAIESGRHVQNSQALLVR